MTWPPRHTGPDRLPAERRDGDVQFGMRLFASLDAGFVKLYRKYMGLHVYQQQLELRRPPDVSLESITLSG